MFMVLHILPARIGSQFGKIKANDSFSDAMNKLIFFVIFVLSYQIAASQPNDLIYKKIIPGISIELKPYRDSSGYAVSYAYAGLYATPLIDVGIWTESTQNILVDDVYYNTGVVVYNSDFEPEGYLRYFWLKGSNFHPLSIERTILNCNKTGQVADDSEFPAIPPVTDYPSEMYAQSVFMEYDAQSETNVGLMGFSSPSINTYIDAEPFMGFYDAGNENMKDRRNVESTLILGDSILICYLELYDTQALNDTIVYANLGGQLNLVRVQLNLETNELISQQIGSSTGSQVVLRAAPTRNMQGVLRTGLVRGNNTPVSVSGAQVDMVPNDSLYHVFITKENAAGNTEWLTELYAYNNTAADTLVNNYNTQFRAWNDISSILDKEGAIYVSAKFSATSTINDTLVYRDFLGQNHLYSQLIPYYGSYSENNQNPYADAKVYKLDANGNVVGKLSYIYTQWGQENSETAIPYDFFHKNRIFEVADKLAWVHRYNAHNDTTIAFTYTADNGGEQNTYIDFPAGQGCFILWLDDDLNILDNWLIPFENNAYGGMSINSVIPYQGDTLLIHGSIMQNTSTDLNPFGDSEIYSAETNSSFFAFYSAPEILTDILTNKQKTDFQTYPNPVLHSLHLSGVKSQQASYAIYDLSGRALSKGALSQNESINVSKLNSGMYILSIKTENGSGTAKFVVE